MHKGCTVNTLLCIVKGKTEQNKRKYNNGK